MKNNQLQTLVMPMHQSGVSRLGIDEVQLRASHRSPCIHSWTFVVPVCHHQFLNGLFRLSLCIFFSFFSTSHVIHIWWRCVLKSQRKCWRRLWGIISRWWCSKDARAVWKSAAASNRHHPHTHCWEMPVIIRQDRVSIQLRRAGNARL